MAKINLYGGPGSGKSTVSNLLIGDLKVHQYSADLVQEVAKKYVYKGVDLRIPDPDLQLIIFAQQLEDEKDLAEKVDFIVSDSPLFLNAYYAKQPYMVEVAKRNNSTKDIHIWIERDPNEHFENEGRSHTEAQSRKIDQDMKEFLTNVCGLSLIVLKGTSKEKASIIVNDIIQEILPKKRGNRHVISPNQPKVMPKGKNKPKGKGKSKK